MRDGAGGDNIHLLVGMLADGEEQARQLDARLGEPLDDDDLRLRARRLQRTLGEAVAVARSIEAAAAAAAGPWGPDARYDSPQSADESAGRAPRDAAQERQDVCKRRKGLPRWTKQFRVPDANLEATPDDDFSWRKYGQKDILGAKFPRGYYRCTYRNAQECLATKQVQRSDSDLCVFDVTYQGVHTCHQKQQRHASPASAGAAAQLDDGSQLPPQDPSHQLELLASFKNGLKVETHGLSALPESFHEHGHATAAFPFPAVALDGGATAAAGFSPVESGGQLGGGFSPAFVSPAASAGSSYFSVTHCPAASYGQGGVGTRGVESELGEVVSAATGAAAAPAGFDYFLFHNHDADQLDPHLPFPPMFGHPSQSHGQHRNAGHPSQSHGQHRNA